MARQSQWPPAASTRRLEELLYSPADRLLAIFSDIQPGEGIVGFAMLGAVFLLLTSVYFLKPARDGLLAISGVPGLSDMELKAYSSFGQSLLLLGIVPLYSRFATALDRRSLARGLTLFFVSNLIVFWLLQPGLVVDHAPFLGIVFYLWFGVFNLLALVQFWSFAADFYSEEGCSGYFRRSPSVRPPARRPEPGSPRCWSARASSRRTRCFSPPPWR